MRRTALAAFRALGCAGLARVDFFIDESDQVILNEINTMPGFTSISMYPRMWQASASPTPTWSGPWWRRPWHAADRRSTTVGVHRGSGRLCGRDCG